MDNNTKIRNLKHAIALAESRARAAHTRGDTAVWAKFHVEANRLEEQLKRAERGQEQTELPIICDSDN